MIDPKELAEADQLIADNRERLKAMILSMTPEQRGNLMQYMTAIGNHALANFDHRNWITFALAQLQMQSMLIESAGDEQ